MLEQSSTRRTYTRDAYAPVRRDAHAKAEKINGCLHIDQEVSTELMILCKRRHAHTPTRLPTYPF